MEENPYARPLHSATPAPVPIRVERCPGEGFRDVTILSAIDAALFHWIGKEKDGRSIPCIGRPECARCKRGDRFFWQGFFAALVARDDQGLPVSYYAVWSVSENLDDILTGQAEIGDTWRFSKVQGPDKHKVYHGELLTRWSGEVLRTDINVRSAVQRMHAGVPIQWDAVRLTSARQAFLPIVQTAKLQEKLEAEARERAAVEEDRRKAQEIFQQGKRNIFGAGSRNGVPVVKDGSL